MRGQRPPRGVWQPRLGGSTDDAMTNGSPCSWVEARQALSGAFLTPASAIEGLGVDDSPATASRPREGRACSWAWEDASCMASTFPWGDVPIALGELLRPGLPGVVEEVIAAVRAEVPKYDQPLEGEFRMLISQGVTAALEQFVGLLGRDEDVPDLVTSAGLGRAEHWGGRTLDALQSAYRVGARVAWRAMAQAGAAEGVESTTMYRLAEAIFAYIDRLAAASVAGFAEAEAMHAGALQARRHALLELLASATRPDRTEVARRAEAAGFSPPPRTSQHSLSV
jgi:hypothetical protein